MISGYDYDYDYIFVCMYVFLVAWCNSNPMAASGAQMASQALGAVATAEL